MNQPVLHSEPIDVVYVLGTGSQWNNNEIRFSIRSLEKNLSGFRNIFIVGEKTPFLKNVIPVSAEDRYPCQLNADGNIIQKVLKACQDSRLSENFLFINDDHILLKPVHVADIPAYHKGDMREFKPAYWELNPWRKRLLKTRETLLSKKLPAFHYDCHTPILFNKTLFPQIMRQFDFASDIGLTMKSLYGNSVYRDQGTRLTTQKKTVFSFLTFQQIKTKLAESQFLSFNDQGLNRPLKYFLFQSFPSLSSYEAYPIQDRTIEICAWLESGRDFNQGVLLFQKYLHGVNLIKLFAQGETTSLRTKLIYKFQSILNEITTEH